MGRRFKFLGGTLFVLVYNLFAAGYASVSQGVTISPNPVVLGQKFSVSFTLKETSDTAPITFDSIAVAILKLDDSLLFDLAMFTNVTVAIGGTWSRDTSGQIYTSNPAGAYQAAIRGKVHGFPWFKFSVTGSGVNQVSFQAILPAPTLTSPADNATVSGPPFTFTWSPVSGAGGYQLKLSSDPTFITDIVNDLGINGSATSYTYNSSLTASTTYYWQMRALDGTTGTQWGAWSAVHSFTPQAGSTLLPPTMTSPANGAAISCASSPTTVLLQWNAVTGATGYHLLIDGISIPIYIGAQTSYTATLPVGTHNWKIQTNNVAGYGSYSALWSFTLMSPTSQVLGVDVSSSTPDWQQFKSMGIVFAFARSSLGTTPSNPPFNTIFKTNMDSGNKSGMVMGAYHFAYPKTNSADAEAQYYLQVASSYIKAGSLPPALDIEDDTSFHSYPSKEGPDTLSAWIQRWITVVKQQTQRDPILYCDKSIAKNLYPYLKNSANLWIAAPSDSIGTPNQTGWETWPWSFQQYTHTINMFGSSVDRDIFNGNIDQFNTFIQLPTYTVASHISSDIPELRIFQINRNGYSTALYYTIPKEGSVKVTIYGITGRCLEELTLGVQQVGIHTIDLNQSGQHTSSGFYLAKIVSNKMNAVCKIQIVK
jgi:GH25 family lysozyme M1 (1,4-beta-N-acetylmuramidase)